MKHVKKWPLAILSLLLLLFFMLTVKGMQTYEEKITKLYHEHTLLLGQLAHTNNTNVQNTLLAQFTKKIDLNPQEERMIAVSTKSQVLLDALTLGAPHCLTAPGKGCRVYTGTVLDAAQARQKRVAVLQKRFPEDPIAESQKYSIIELFFKALVLVVEGTIVSQLIYLGVKKAKK